MHQSQIIQHLFQVSSLEDVSRERLESFVLEHPSFGIGHYLLSRKLQKEGNGFAEKTQVTSLYFSNPFWLQWLLENTDVGGKLVVQAAAPPSAVPEAAAPAEQVQGVQEKVAAPPATPAENVVTMAEEAFYEAHTTEPAAPVSAFSETTAEQLLRNIEQARGLRESLQKIATELTGETVAEAIVAEPVVASEPVIAEEPAVAEEAVVAEEPVIPKEPVVVEEPVVAEDPVAAVEQVEQVEQAESTVTAEPVAAEAPIRDEEVPFVLDDQEASAPQAAPITAAAEPTIVFEPYHTIDYFASQGIKLTLEENPADKLGQQLKSFTDWLKVMRRLPQKNKEVIPDRVAEQAIQSFAAHSIEGKEVLTEAMAEVLAKQGMRERARSVYEKLSLLNPEKSAYFAAKIEQLNIL